MSVDSTNTWNRAAEIKRVNDAYNKAMHDINVTADKADISLSYKQKVEILESYGIRKPELSGLDAKALRDTVESNLASIRSGSNRMASDLAGKADSNGSVLDNLGNGRRRQEASLRQMVAASKANDDAAKLQALARQHKIKLSRAEAKLLLKKNPKILDMKPEKALSVIKTSKSKVIKAAKAGKAIGARAATYGFGLASRVANSVDSDDVGINGQDAGAAGINAKEAFDKLTEKKRIMDAEKRQIDKEAKEAQRRLRRKQKAEQRVRDSSNKDLSQRAKKGHTKQVKTAAKNAKKQAKNAAAESMKAKQRADSVRRLVAQKKTAAKAAAAVKEAIAKVVSAIITAITSVVTSSVAIAVIAIFFILILIVILVTVIVTVITALLYSPPMGDWYDPQTVKYVDFVDATQDMQTKYYDDCLMLAYRYGTDAPTPEECAIDWGEVYTLWAAIVNYRSENDLMSTPITETVEGTEYTFCSYDVGGMFLVADDTNASLFLPDGEGADDYIQDLYLAFYFMYYDLRGMDEAGNPFLTDISNGDRYVPNYESDGTVGGHNFSSFSEESGYPMRNVRTDEIVTNMIYLDENDMWAINTTDYPNMYFSFGSSDSTGGTDGGAGYICRGYPLMNTTTSTFSDSWSTASSYEPIYANFSYQGTCFPANIGYQTFSGLNVRNEDGWTVTALYDQYGNDCSDRIGEIALTTSDFAYHPDAISSGMTGAQYIASVHANCASLTGHGRAGTHQHIFSGLQIGSYYVAGEEGDVSYDYSEISFTHLGAQDGLARMHEAYLACYEEYYATHTGLDRTFDSTMAYVISSENRTAVEGVSTGHDYDEMLIILNQIFDRNNYYPWTAAGATDGYGYYVRQGYSSLPGTKDTWDCYLDISADIETALNSKYYPTDYNGNGYLRPNGAALWLPPVSDGPIPLINFRSEEQCQLWFEVQCGEATGYYWIDSLQNDIIASIIYSEDCWPFKVYDTGDYEWIQGDLNSYIGSGGKWNNISYLMYRWLTCEKGLTPQSAAGCLGALYHETNFNSSYSTIPTEPDSNGCWAIGLLQWNAGIEFRSDASNFYENPIIEWCISKGYDWTNAGAQLRYADYWLSDSETGRAWVFDSLHSIQNGETAVTLLSPSSAYSSWEDWTEAAWGCYYWARNVEVCAEGCGYGSDGPEGDGDAPRMTSAVTYLYYIENSDPNFVSIEGAELSGGTVAPVTTSSAGEAAVEIAKTLIGTPYVFGGCSPSGIDCSGLTRYCYLQLGYDLPHGATMQCDSSGTFVSYEDMQPGDLVCYQSPSDPDVAQHVALYVGNGQVIHASSSRGVVCYGDVNMMEIRGIKRIG